MFMHYSLDFLMFVGIIRFILLTKTHNYSQLKPFWDLREESLLAFSSIKIIGFIVANCVVAFSYCFCLKVEILGHHFICSNCGWVFFNFCWVFFVGHHFCANYDYCCESHCCWDSLERLKTLMNYYSECFRFCWCYCSEMNFIFLRYETVNWWFSWGSFLHRKRKKMKAILKNLKLKIMCGA